MPAVTVPPRPNGIADRDHPGARLGGVAVAKIDERQRVVRLYLEHSEVAGLVVANHFRRQNGAVIHGDRHRFGAVDHVVVRHDRAVGVDQEARTARLDGARALLLLRLHAEGEREGEALAAMAEARLALALCLVLFWRDMGGDRDHGGLHAVHQAHEIGQWMADSARIDRARLGLGHIGLGERAVRRADQCQAAERRGGEQGGAERAAHHFTAGHLTAGYLGRGLGHAVILPGWRVSASIAACVWH